MTGALTFVAKWEFDLIHGPAGSKKAHYEGPDQVDDPTGVYARTETECDDAPMSLTVLED
jgi:hypothetical protein